MVGCAPLPPFLLFSSKLQRRHLRLPAPPPDRRKVSFVPLITTRLFYIAVCGRARCMRSCTLVLPPLNRTWSMTCAIACLCSDAVMLARLRCSCSDWRSCMMLRVLSYSPMIFSSSCCRPYLCRGRQGQGQGQHTRHSFQIQKHSPSYAAQRSGRCTAGPPLPKGRVMIADHATKPSLLTDWSSGWRPPCPAAS